MANGSILLSTFSSHSLCTTFWNFLRKNKKKDCPNSKAADDNEHKVAFSDSLARKNICGVLIFTVAIQYF